MPSNQLREWIQLAKKHFEGKNYDRAQTYFLKVIRSGGSRFADVQNSLGVIYHIEGRFNEAIKAFQDALSINPNYTEASLNLAILYNDLGQYKKSKDLYSKVQKKKNAYALDPVMVGKLANLHADVGDLYRGSGLYKESIEEYKKALKVAPHFADIRTKLGVAYRDNQQNAHSVKELETTIKNSPNYLNGLLQLGVTHYPMGKKDLAKKAWQKALKIDSSNQIAMMYLKLCAAK